MSNQNTCDCKNCQVVERTKRGVLACSRPAGPGIDDDIVEVWNSTLKDFPCLKKKKKEDSG